MFCTGTSGHSVWLQVSSVVYRTANFDMQLQVGLRFEGAKGTRTCDRVFVGEWLFVFPLCGFSLSLFCNYL